jgi:hypothetical protein
LIRLGSVQESSTAPLPASPEERTGSLPLAELRRGPRAGFLDGFVSEAWQISRAVPVAEYTWSLEWSDRAEEEANDSYYHVRVRQKNDQRAWSSPIWVGDRT